MPVFAPLDQFLLLKKAGSPVNESKVTHIDSAKFVWLLTTMGMVRSNCVCPPRPTAGRWPWSDTTTTCQFSSANDERLRIAWSMEPIWESTSATCPT